MSRAAPLGVLAVVAVGLALLARSGPRAAEPRPEPYRSPVGLAPLPDGRRALTANHTSDSASLVDLRGGKVLAEAPCGRKPAAVVCSRDGKHAAVSNLWGGTVTLFDVAENSLKSAGEIAVGALPRGLAFAPDGEHLYVALAGQDEIAEVERASRKVVRRWPAPREPRCLAVSQDGDWLAAASSRSAQVRVWDTRTGKLRWERKIEDAFNLRGLCFTPDGASLLCAHAVRRDFPVSKTNIEEGWVIDNRLSLLPLKADAVPPLKQVALDRRGEAAADPHGLAFDASGKTLAVTASGTQELLLFEAGALPWNGGDPGDFLDAALVNDGKLRRVALGGRPLAIAFLPDGGRFVLANYLLDALQIVEARTGKVERTIALGVPEKPTLARRGEALFYDAKCSHHQWFSCHTCHVDGHTCGLNFDTLNDDSYGNPKLTPSLHGVTRTGPWTWHGWQTDLGAGVEKSFTQTMFGPRPDADERKAILAFLETLEHAPNPHRGPDGKPSAAARRGEQLFAGKARCARCHDGPDYTSKRNYDVKLEPDGSPYTLWNPPTLRGLWERGPYLHDGRAKTLDELLRKHHAPEKLGGQALTPAERQDLLEFLNSL